MKCPNCDAVQTGRYCSSCGQDNRRTRLTLSTLFDAAVEQYFSLDSRVWRTIGELARDPGGLVRRYNAGMRRRYVNPVRFLLAMTLLWWTVVYLVNPAGFVDAIEHPGLRFVARYGQVINLLLVPVLALPQWLIFLGGPFGLVQHLALVMFVFGQLFLLRAMEAGFSVVGPVEWLEYVLYLDLVVMIGLYVCALVFSMRGRCRWLLVRVIVAVVALMVTSEFVGGALIGAMMKLLA